MKTRIIEAVITLVTAAALLGGYWIFSQIQAHRAMDRALLSLIEQQVQKEGK